MHGRRSDSVEIAQRADMILVAMAQDDGVDLSDRSEIRQPAGLGPLAAVEQQPAARRLDHERRRLLGAEA